MQALAEQDIDSDDEDQAEFGFIFDESAYKRLVDKYHRKGEIFFYILTSLTFLSAIAIFSSILYFTLQTLLQGWNLVYAMVISIGIYSKDVKVTLEYLITKITESGEETSGV